MIDINNIILIDLKMKFMRIKKNPIPRLKSLFNSLILR